MVLLVLAMEKPERNEDDNATKGRENTNNNVGVAPVAFSGKGSDETMAIS